MCRLSVDLSADVSVLLDLNCTFQEGQTVSFYRSSGEVDVIIVVVEVG